MLQEININTFIEEVQSPNTNIFQEWAPILSPSVVLLLFVLGQIIDSSKRRRESQRALYYKVYLEPSIEQLNLFFKEIDKLVLINGEVRRDTINNPKTLVKVKKSIGDKKRSFEDTCLLIVQPRYPIIFIDATDLLNTFQDDVYKILEEGGLNSGLDYKSHRSIIRRDIITVLSKPAVGKK